MNNPREFREEFSARVKLARESAGYTQEEIASLLGMSQPTYNKYEGSRASIMPTHLQAKFALICRVSLDWLLTGKGEGPFRPMKRRKGAA
jgi:transcriptional regulator with XRE-family HTH domain